MNSSSNLIRSLLDRYYDGSATPDEVARLKAFFTSGAAVDADLEADRRLFTAMESASATPEVPEELTRRLGAIGSRRPKIMRFAAWGLSAAAVAAVIVAAVNVTGHDKPMAMEPVPADLSEINIARNVEAVADTVAPTDSITVEEPVAAAAKTPRRKKKKVRQSSDERRLTPEERRVERRTVDLINRSLAKVSIACYNVEASLENIDNTLTEINK